MLLDVARQVVLLASGAVVGCLLILIVTGLLWVLRAITTDWLPVSAMKAMGERERFITHPLWLLLFAGIEEAFARAFLIGWLGRYTGLLAAFVISAVVFAALHLPNGRPTVISMLNLVLVTVVFGLIYLKFGLLAAIGTHYGWNLMQWPILGYPLYGKQAGRRLRTRATGATWLSGGEFGPEYSAVASVLLAVCIAGLWLLFRQ